MSSSTTASSSATSAATPLDKVSYYSGDGNENAKLSSSYKSYKLYNHVKGANANQSTYSWSSVSAKTGKKVYLDRGVKQNQIQHGIELFSNQYFKSTVRDTLTF